MAKKAEKDYAYWERQIPETNIAQMAERLEALREALQIETKADFARRVGISPSEYGNWLGGTARPTIHKAAAVAKACRVTLDFIVLGDLSGLPNKLHDDIAARLAAMSRRNSPRRKA